jgi:NRPS condensation-like uncharacterized protein
VCYDVLGELDVAALENALLALVQRHAILRTVYSWDDEQSGLRQRVTQLPTNTPFMKVVASNVNAKAVARSVARLCEEPFDLARGPVVRALLVPRSPSHARLHVVFHHICVDQWSLDLVESEISTLYRHFASLSDGSGGGSLESVAPSDMQYYDFARWQQVC